MSSQDDFKRRIQKAKNDLIQSKANDANRIQKERELGARIMVLEPKIIAAFEKVAGESGTLVNNKYSVDDFNRRHKNDHLHSVYLTDPQSGGQPNVYREITGVWFGYKRIVHEQNGSVKILPRWDEVKKYHPAAFVGFRPFKKRGEDFLLSDRLMTMSDSEIVSWAEQRLREIVLRYFEK